MGSRRCVPVGKREATHRDWCFRTSRALRSAELEDPMDDGSASEASTLSNSSGLAPRELAHGLFFSPESYHRRWSFRRANGSVGGIPLEELQASAVCEPGTGRLWLSTKKVFTLKLEGGSQRMVADADQAVPMCNLYLCSLQRKRPLMPTWALANDLWQSKLPKVLEDLGEIAWHLLRCTHRANNQEPFFCVIFLLFCDQNHSIPWPSNSTTE